MKNYWIVIFCLLMLHPLSGISETALTMGGAGVKFATWSPVKTNNQYLNLAPDKKQIDKYIAAGFSQVDLLEQRSLTFLSNGNIEETVIRARYFLNNAGIESNGNGGIWVDSYYGKVSILSAHTLNPSGKVFEVDPATIQVTSDTNPNIFTDNFYVSVPFPKLSPESLTVLTYKIEHNASKMPLPWGSIYYPKRFSYLENFSFSMHWENEEVKPEWKTDYDKLNCVDLERSIQCSAKNNSAQLDDPDIGNYRNILPHLVVAQKSSWGVIRKEMGEIMESALTHDPAIRVATQALIQEMESELDKMNKIHDFVARKIRYVGIEHGRGGIVPRLTTKTFERQFGDCKDKVALFIEMARMAGLEAYPVLASTQRKNLNKFMLPAHIYFNHVVACVRTKNGKEQCTDLTDPFTDSTQLPYYMNGTVGLPLEAENNQPVTFPEMEFTWKVKMVMSNELQSDGSIIETLDRSYLGHYGSFFRGKLAYKTNQEKSNWYNEGYKGVMGTADNVKFETSGLENLSAPVVIRSSTQYKDTFKPDSFESFSETEFWLRDLMRQFKTANKHNSYNFAGLHYTSEITYTVPKEFAVKNVGANYNYEHEFGDLKRHYVRTENKIDVITEVKIPRIDVSADKLQVFNDFLEFISNENKINFNVKNH